MLHIKLSANSKQFLESELNQDLAFLNIIKQVNNTKFKKIKESISPILLRYFYQLPITHTIFPDINSEVVEDAKAVYRQELIDIGKLSKTDANKLVDFTNQCITSAIESLNEDNILVLSLDSSMSKIICSYLVNTSDNRMTIPNQKFIEFTVNENSSLQPMYNRLPSYFSEFKKYILIFSVLLRYSSTTCQTLDKISHVGFQMTLPDSVFKVLHTDLKVKTECFASPLNVNKNTESFCSLYIDIDKYFGSLGSFFDVDLQPGSYECNPPFTEYHVNKALERIQTMYMSRSEAYSFVVILPAWTDMKIITDMSEKYKAYIVSRNTITCPDTFKLIVGNFYYENGLSVIDSFNTLKMNKPSIVLIIQNESGKKLYPWTTEVEDKFFEAWTELH